MSCPALLNSFTNDDRGSASLEFGLVIVPFIFTILLTLFLALFLFIQTSLTNIVNIEARHIMTGRMWAQDGTDYYLQAMAFRTEAQELLPRGLPKYLLSIQVDSADSLEGLHDPPLGGSYYRPGGPSSYAIIVATYDLPFIKSLASIFHLPSMVSATTLLKLEPYDS